MEFDAMSNDVTFEELEKTAFEFAKVMGTGTGANLSQNAMRMAEKWHAERRLRESLYGAKRAKWEKIDIRADYSANYFIVDQDYWVIAWNDSSPKIAKFSKSSKQLSSNGPMFYDDGSDEFTISYYLTKEEGDKILAETPPKRPKEVEEESVRPQVIPTMKSHWQS